MANFFYTDAYGYQQGPYDMQQLQELAAEGVITPQTPMETEMGEKGVAGQIPGLFGSAFAVPGTQAGASGVAIAALVLGIVRMFAWCLPILGLPVNVAGLICGVLGLSKNGRGMAMTGIVLSSIGLLFTILNAVAGVLLVMSGQHPLF